MWNPDPTYQALVGVMKKLDADNALDANHARTAARKKVMAAISELWAVEEGRRVGILQLLTEAEAARSEAK